MEETYKEVYFDQFCKKCEFKDLDEKFDPCHECLSDPTNLYSHRPVKYKEATTKKKAKKENT